VNPRGQLTQLSERILGTRVRRVDQFPRRGEIAGSAVGAEFLPGHAEVHRERGQPDLSAVVQVAFHLAQHRRGVVHRQCARPGRRTGPPARHGLPRAP